MVTLAFNAHWSDFLSGILLLSSGLRFRSNDHFMKHAYSLRPCSSSTARGPYMLGAREAPGGILGSPRGYASGYMILSDPMVKSARFTRVFDSIIFPDNCWGRILDPMRFVIKIMIADV